MLHLTCPQLAENTGYSRMQILRWARASLIPGASETKGGHFRFDQSKELATWIKTHAKTERRPLYKKPSPNSRRTLAIKNMQEALKSGRATEGDLAHAKQLAYALNSLLKIGLSGKESFPVSNGVSTALKVYLSSGAQIETVVKWSSYGGNLLNDLEDAESHCGFKARLPKTSPPRRA